MADLERRDRIRKMVAWLREHKPDDVSGDGAYPFLSWAELIAEPFKITLRGAGR